MNLFRNTLPLVLVTLVFLQGCRRKPETPASSTPTAPQDSLVPTLESTPAPPPPPPAPPSPASESADTAPAAEKHEDKLPTAAPDSSLRFPVHKELTEAVHLYRLDNAKLPGDFAVLVKERYLKQVPQPPPGKKFALDRNRLQVVIVDR
jgi:hypothetical protein